MEYYAAPNGNDSNPGTLAEPWATPLQIRNALVGQEFEV